MNDVFSIDLPGDNENLLATISNDQHREPDMDDNPIVCTDIMVSLGKMRASIKPTGNDEADAARFRFLWDNLSVLAQRQFAEDLGYEADFGGDFRHDLLG